MIGVADVVEFVFVCTSDYCIILVHDGTVQTEQAVTMSTGLYHRRRRSSMARSRCRAGGGRGQREFKSGESYVTVKQRSGLSF